MALCLALFLALPAKAETCAAGTIRYVVFGAQKTEKADYCFNQNKTCLASPTCATKVCEAFKNPRRFESSELLSPVGNPGSALCQKLGGTFQLLEFSAGKEFFALDRCLFHDGTFVDSASLLGFYLQR